MPSRIIKSFGKPGSDAMTRDRHAEWEQAVLDALNASLRRNWPGALSGRAPRPTGDVIDEPAQLVGEYPDTVIRVTWGRPGSDRRFQQEWELWREFGVDPDLRVDPESIATGIEVEIGP
jgi:hypothetical protein